MVHSIDEALALDGDGAALGVRALLGRALLGRLAVREVRRLAREADRVGEAPGPGGRREEVQGGLVGADREAVGGRGGVSR